MSDDRPGVSVYMPAYNVAAYVREAVQSVLNQTFSDFELIIVDDGSTDDTAEMLKQLSSEDKRIRLFNQPHVGVSAASNFAIEQARAELIARVDSDDVALPNRLEMQVRYMREHPECVALGSSMLLIDEHGLPLYPMSQIKFGHGPIEAALLTGSWAIAQPSCMYRREAVIAAGGYQKNLSLHEDHDLFLRLAERGKLENLQEILQHYRQRSSSLTARESAGSHHLVMPEILRQARRRRGMPEDVPMKPAKAPQGTLDRFRRWAWGSLKAGHVKTARKYARATLVRSPFSLDSWRLLYCSLRGY
jgi:glycosyltransferase involved in cell wall biosynthesis